MTSHGRDNWLTARLPTTTFTDTLTFKNVLQCFRPTASYRSSTYNDRGSGRDRGSVPGADCGFYIELTTDDEWIYAYARTEERYKEVEREEYYDSDEEYDRYGDEPREPSEPVYVQVEVPPDFKLIGCRICVVDGHGKKRNVCDEEDAEMLSELSAGRLVRCDELRDRNSGLLTKDGHLEVMCCLTVLLLPVEGRLTVVDLRPCGEVGRLYRNGSQPLGRTIYQLGLFCDVTVCAQGRHFAAHRAVLVAASTVFRTMFETAWARDATGRRRIDVDDTSADVVEDLLTFIYTGDAPNMNTLADGLLVAANTLELAKLQAACEAYVTERESDGEATANTNLVVDQRQESKLDSAESTDWWPSEPVVEFSTAKGTIRTFLDRLTFENVSKSFANSAVDSLSVRLQSSKSSLPDDSLSACLELQSRDGWIGLCIPSKFTSANSCKLTYYSASVVCVDGQLRNKVVGDLWMMYPQIDNWIEASRLLDTDNGLLTPDDTLVVQFDARVFSLTDAVFIEAFTPSLDDDETLKSSHELRDETVGRIHLDAGLFSDVTIHVAGRQLPAHRFVLAAESPVFRRMFDAADMREKYSEGRVDIVDIEANVVEEMLTFLYKRELPNLTSMCVELLAAADKYDVAALKSVCEDQLASTLDDKNAFQTVVIADRHNASRLKKSALNWIARHRNSLPTASWKCAAELKDHEVDMALFVVKWVLRRLSGDPELPENNDGIRFPVRFMRTSGFQLLEKENPRLALETLNEMMLELPPRREKASIDLLHAIIDAVSSCKN